VVLLDGAAAAKEGDEEDDAADHDQENGGVEELRTRELNLKSFFLQKLSLEC
jgi:hypothetical protein